MGYKDLIEQLRAVESRSKGDLLERAATAIEDLQAERDAALSMHKAYEEERRAICRAALECWGGEAQTKMVFEEMAELQKELCKHARGRDNREAIAEEIADVRNTLIQMCILHDCADLAEEYQDEKLIRTLGKIEKAMEGETEDG